MIRRRAARLAIVLLCWTPLPALADVTAHYRLGVKDALTVEVDDGGNARLSMEGKFSLITRDGVDYVAIMLKGQVLVVRYADLLALAKTKFAVHSDAETGDEAPAFVLAGGAPAEVAGRKGMSWTLGLDNAPPGGRNLALVMSDDPELAPVGAMIRRIFEPAVPILLEAFPASSGLASRVSELLAKGTPLRAAPFLELVSIDHKDIDSHRFDLPGSVMRAEDFDKATDAGDSKTSVDVALPPLP